MGIRYGRNGLMLALLASVLLPALVGHAQGTTWNRRVTEIRLDETTTAGVYDIRAGFEVLAGGGASATLSNVDTEIEFFINSLSVGTVVVSVAPTGATPSSCAPAACGGSCGGGSFGGTSGMMSCQPDGAAGCDCVSPPLEGVLPMQPLQPHDYLEILLRPSPGALPDSDSTDDTGELRFGSWNRVLDSIEVEPDPAGPGSIIRANFHVEIFEQNTLPLPLDTRITFEQNATTVGDEIMVLLRPSPGGIPFCAAVACSATLCGSMDVNGASNDMFCDPVECDCRLEGLNLEVATPAPVPPSEPLKVILKPAPGALPELPGFGDDELDRVPVPAFTRGGLAAIAILLGIAALWLVRRRAP